MLFLQKQIPVTWKKVISTVIICTNINSSVEERSRIYFEDFIYSVHHLINFRWFKHKQGHYLNLKHICQTSCIFCKYSLKLHKVQRSSKFLQNSLPLFFSQEAVTGTCVGVSFLNKAASLKETPTQVFSCEVPVRTPFYKTGLMVFLSNCK